MNDVTNRFCEVFNNLLSENKVTGQKQFALEIGISTSMMTEIIKGRSNVGVLAIQNTVIKFDIDAYWILTGKHYNKNNEVR